jgi:hypothetical protein
MADEAINLLRIFYSISGNVLPAQRPIEKWEAENKLGFFLGIIQYGTDAHLKTLLELLRSEKFEEEQQFSDPYDDKQTFITEMFDFYILPFHRGYSTSCCYTGSESSGPNSSPGNGQDYVDLSHGNLKNALLARDKACLFCWSKEALHGSHIISQMSIITVDEMQILQNSGLKQKHQVQNGLLLCACCHPRFDKLKRYVDVVDDNLVLKVVNEANDENSEKHREWTGKIKDLKRIRKVREEDWTDNRKAIESNGEMG